ncbi:uncharacterized protein LOC141875597 isoform X3 [Acropora palmata]|uniref:uncharacterized protein LOC141875597 isoform X3 n=1 Tax=Acropora palmata TaxID=6131 RepID=UPI003DA1408E
MASAQEDDCLSSYRTFLLDLSSKLLIDDLERLKFACKDVVPYGKIEEVRTGFKLFDLLEQNGIISPQRLIPLENMMKAIGRADLALEVNQFMIAGNDVPDGAQQAEARETRVEANQVSYELLPSAPPALNDPPTAPRTTPIAHVDNIASTASGGREASPPVTWQSSSKPRLSNPEGQETVQYVNFLVLEGYSVQIVGGKHFSTPGGEFVELKSGTQYEIRLKNSHPYACHVDISIDGYDVGGWIMQGGQQFTVERPAHEAKKFTFYRVKKAPKDSGIDPSRTEENGVVKCVFTPEAFVDIPVTISGSSQPLMISLAPSATVGDLKQKIQQKLNKSPDLNQILAQNDEALKNHMSVRRVVESPQSLILIDVELNITVEASTSETFQVKIRPGEAKIIDLMRKIEVELQVPIKDLTLFHGKIRLSDRPHKDLPRKLIYSLNRTVVVIVPDYIEITIEDLSCGKSITLKIDKEKHLSDLVQEIPSCRNMDDNQEAMFLVDGKELSPVQDTGTLTSLGICSGSRVKFEVRVVFIKVFVAGLPQGRLTVQCNPLETFQDLLNHVQSRTNMAEIDATFSANGRDFDAKKDLDTLQGYGIQHRSTVVLKMEEPHSNKSKLRDQPTKETEEEKLSSSVLLDLIQCLKNSVRKLRRNDGAAAVSNTRNAGIEKDEMLPVPVRVPVPTRGAAAVSNTRNAGIEKDEMFPVPVRVPVPTIASRRLDVRLKGAVGCSLEDEMLPVPVRKTASRRLDGRLEAEYGSIQSRKDPLWRAGATTLQGCHEMLYEDVCEPAGESDPEDGFAKRASRRRAGESPIASNSIRASSPLLRRIQTRNDPLWRAGGTTLQGHSYQRFEPTTDPITADPSKKVELVLRLVAREDEPDVKFPTGLCTPLSTLRPPPVPE